MRSKMDHLIPVSTHYRCPFPPTPILLYIVGKYMQRFLFFKHYSSIIVKNGPLVPNCHQVYGNVVPINVCGLKYKLSQFRCIIFQILLKMGPLTPVLTLRGTPLSAEIIISICYQIYGDVLRINFRGLKWNLIQFSWVTFQILMKMGHLTSVLGPFWGIWPPPFVIFVYTGCRR